MTIWVVLYGDDLYVRSVNGCTGTWFRGTQALHEGRIWVGSAQKDVTFEEKVAPTINDQIDAAYCIKYCRYAANIISFEEILFVSLQDYLNLIYREENREMLPLCSLVISK